MQQENKYPIGGYAPGNYYCTCSICGIKFQGDKRAVQCESCAVESLREILKPYEQQRQGVMWVKATDRLPDKKTVGNILFINEIHGVCFYCNPSELNDLGSKMNLNLQGWSLMQWQWLDEGGQSKEPVPDNALYETRLALHMLLKTFKSSPKTEAQQKYFAQGGYMLQKHGSIYDVLRTAQSKEGNKEREICIDELWDEHSELIDDDIDSLSRWAGSTVIDKAQFRTVVALIWERFNNQQKK